MALTYSQFVYGFEIFDEASGVNQNDKLDIRRPQGEPLVDVDYIATLNAGVYTAKEFADEVKRAMIAADGGNNYDVAFSFTTLKFTITGTTSFTLRVSDGPNNVVDCKGLLGFDPATNKTGSSIVSDVAVGAPTHSTAKLWAMAEPNSKVTPVEAQADGTPGKLLQRDVSASQSRSDGGAVETIYKHTMKRVTIGFKALTTDEQSKMESFLDWIEQGRRFNWQPNKESTNALRLVVAEPKAINNDFTWLTRSETDYGDLTFLEQVSRT